MNGLIERSKRFCGFLVGIVFFVSGVLKLLDPVGAGLVVEEYYNFLHVGFLDFSAKAVAVLFALTETLAGAALITGVWRRVVAITVLSFQAFFTLLTLALVIFNPAMDCGCFGEAVHLTHLQTFAKNIVLCILSCASFFPLSALGRPKKRKYVAFAIVSSIVTAFTVHSLLFIPLVDFTDYKPSRQLEAAQSYSDVAGSQELYEAVFVYEKNGVQKEFTLEALPDSTWTYVSTKTVKNQAVTAETEVAISLPLIDRAGEYHNEIAAAGPVMAVSVYDPESLSHRRWKDIAAFITESSAVGFMPIVVVSSTPSVLDEVMQEIGDDYVVQTLKDRIWFSDYKTLISMNRSNGGLTYFHDGYLLRKWAARNYPDKEDLHSTSISDATEILLSYSTKGNITFQGLLLVFFAVMLLV